MNSSLNELLKNYIEIYSFFFHIAKKEKVINKQIFVFRIFFLFSLDELFHCFLTQIFDDFCHVTSGFADL